jgi:hypothetical protein
VKLGIDCTPKDWQFGFGFSLSAISQLPTSGYYIISPFDIAIYLGPVTASLIFGKRQTIFIDESGRRAKPDYRRAIGALKGDSSEEGE